MAPDMRPEPSNAPGKLVRGISIKTEAISSAIPVPILPQGSIPKMVKSFTESGCAENLKKSV